MTPHAAKEYTVLVVDDDPSVLSCYRRLLSRAGYRTITESDPRRLVADKADAVRVDLLLVDYKMPGLDGLSLLAELRRRDCRARCILLSAFVNEDVAAQARALGVDLVLNKPIDAEALRRAIGGLLPRVGVRRAAEAAG